MSDHRKIKIDDQSFAELLILLDTQRAQFSAYKEDKAEAEVEEKPEQEELLIRTPDELLLKDTMQVQSSLLDMIAAPESGGDPNIIYGGGHENLTGMTINEVRAYQSEMLARGMPSSAVGKFQIISKTMNGLIDEMGLSGNEIFDEAMQDRMAMHLLDRRGYQDFLKGEMKLDSFVTNLSKEWASLPKDLSGQSYYHGDGLNRAGVGYETVANVLRQDFKENALSFNVQNKAGFDIAAPTSTFNFTNS